jgi:hypothetical protein
MSAVDARQSAREAQQLAEAAAAAARQARIAEAKASLEQARASARRIDRLLAEHEREIRRLDGEEVAAQLEWSRAHARVDDWLAAEPTDVLTAEPESARWKAEYDRLVRKQITAAARVTDIQRDRSVPELEILKLRRQRGNLQGLARNLEAVTRGEDFTAGFRGGIGAPV